VIPTGIHKFFGWLQTFTTSHPGIGSRESARLERFFAELTTVAYLAVVLRISEGTPDSQPSGKEIPLSHL
jgi:hypothetical protein